MLEIKLNISHLPSCPPSRALKYQAQQRPHQSVNSTSPFIKCAVLGVSLERPLLYDEPHLLEEGGGGSWRLPLEEDVDGLGDGVAQLVTLTVSTGAALWVLTVSQSV